MHLLLAQQGTISDGEEAIDLGQTPGDILFLSAADSELAAIATAHRERGAGPSLRLASLMSMKHPMSVDTYVERTARHAKLIIVRALGGASYFHYALEALHAAAARAGALIAVLPGDARPDAGLVPFSNIGLDDLNALWAYLIEGGDANAQAFLDYAGAMLSGAEKPAPAVPLMKAGIWWPGRGLIGVEEWRRVVAAEVSSRVAVPLSVELETPPSVLPDISPTRGEIEDERSRSISSAEGTASSNVSFVGSSSDLPISPLVGEMSGRTEGGTTNSTQQASPIVAISFYRALVQSGETGPIEALIEALTTLGLRPLPVFAYSLKDPVSTGILESVFSTLKPDVVINTTGFAVSAPGADRQPTVLEANEAIVLQAILSASSREAWLSSSQGLSARDLGMNVALPEVDGRVLARAISFKTAARYDARVETNIVASQADAGRVHYTAELAANWARLRKTSVGDRRIALVMANYPNRDGRLGNGVGLDTPAGTIEVLRAMRAAGYPVADIPADGDALIRHLMEGPTNSGSDGKIIRETLSLSRYNSFLESLPNKIQNEVSARWGSPQDDPYFREGVFALPFTRFGDVLVGIQPARGYNIDPKESYHSPDLVPPHGYLAFYAFLRREFGAHAIIHMGKHGNLEWLPGKALALSESCYPEAILGPLPHLYPFIVNDPGEGTQAKRRSAAVIIDHLTPPLTRAESYGPLKDLEALVDEYYEASGGDPRRIRLLSRQILDLVTDIGLDRDAGIAEGESEGEALKKLDAYLCDLKEMQIRDGLHVFGVSPEGRLLTDLTVALARVPRGLGEGGDASLQRAIAADAGLGGGVRGIPPSVLPDISPTRGEIGKSLGLPEKEPFEDAAPSTHEIERGLSSLISPLVGEMSDRTEGGASIFDPLDCDMAVVWTSPRPDILADILDTPWRTNGDTVERIELLAAKFVSGEMDCPADWKATRAVLSEIETWLKPSILACGPAEVEGLLKGLDGRFVAPGPSGAPTRGRPDVLPTGRNFYSVDSRAVPTPAAYELGKKSAELLVRRYVQDHGEWPVSFGLTAWGTSNMRTGGDDIAQALALIGVKPLWDASSRRVTGYEIIPPAMLRRPRVDVTLRISGFFRDAFPEQIALFDKAIRAVGALEEDVGDNPIAERMRGEAARLAAAGLDEVSAKRRAGYRVFGSKPGAYGAGLQPLIDEKGWERRADLAEAYLVWGSYAYGAGEEGKAERGLFEERLRSVQAVIQNQDNREHDLLDSDDYYQFEGGMAAAAEQLAGARPSIYHNDHSRPEKPVIRSLEEEIGRVVRGRVVNPKWISGVMRHGYKGAAEIAATVDYLFAFSATTGAVGEHHFEAVYQAFVADAGVRDFMIEKNPAAFDEMRERLCEAIDRSLWTPRSNSARFHLAANNRMR
ncbi:cobaltochelatase subunit CobN [Rhizobium laguerreae]|uniref:cobaltochelatase subunit CobN n=5 Tax=Rhizobium laguerreae TaxID=1076926 RepID=UPI001C90B4D3|nr:cobaltochelatase subunit CobN [Rhizobium laguerreae]MBY3069697.1 cobaltochelatase subunit CobN [Rhizobium laguerreae]MBY3089930.1 cobaltochelatase subunit CobN [Rhizobium laguerreae]MBY3247882.1 cobaltochelatase subunit CobN [Rhizobium laguerreae]MBY3316345.1 cobaltochelatase subunit CobN [Rhizobium laguerreae]MBY3359409.1 cobaltochelatase subunit CobN [Rhizobium laguerreae]